MAIQLMCTSHSPLINLPDMVTAAESAEVRKITGSYARLLQDYAPDLIVQFGNDHNGGFALDLMPPFALGLRVRTLGDFKTSRGALLVDERRGRTLAKFLHESGVDVATSYDMLVDHGFVQALDLIAGGINRIPVIPIFINCGGDMRPPLHRVVALGRAVGACIRQWSDSLRILILGSGGLSHDPPLPNFETSPPEVREAMMKRTQWTDEMLHARAERVAALGVEHGQGQGPLQPLNPQWDRDILAKLSSFAFDELAQMTDDEILRQGGRGGAEIRNWIAAFAALHAAVGPYRTNIDYYAPIHSWIAGYALARAAAA